MPGQTKARSFTFTLPDGSRSVGNISVTVSADVNHNLFEYNAAGNAESNNDAAVSFTGTLASYPDLQVANLSVDPASGLTSGSTFTVRWADSNTGTKAASGSWNDRVVIRNTTTNETLVDTTVAYNAAVSGNIVPGSSQPRQFGYQLPDGARGIGNIQITVTVDSASSGSGAVFESNAGGNAETNNSNSVTVSSAAGAYPDLQVGNLEGRCTERGPVGRQRDAPVG